MSDAPEPTVQQLFKRWRGGDADAGTAMAQKFTDWYYAITAVRLGDQLGRDPLQRACGVFAEGIVGVMAAGDLVDWAHGIIAKELAQVGGRTQGGDFPNALTANQSPAALLREVRPSLAPEQAEVLDAAYGGRVSLDELIAVAERHSGWPDAVLDARYALKRALKTEARINFDVAPEQPDLDRVPLPLYEAARMASEHEEASFEKWLISDIELCRDVAEFATFAHALRAGAFAGPHPSPAPVAPAVTMTAPPPPTEAAPPPAVAPAKQRPPAEVMGLTIASVLVVLAVIVGVLYFSLKT